VEGRKLGCGQLSGCQFVITFFSLESSLFLSTKRQFADLLMPFAEAAEADRWSRAPSRNATTTVMTGKSANCAVRGERACKPPEIGGGT
jgi:hypothetical protein